MYNCLVPSNIWIQKEILLKNCKRKNIDLKVIVTSMHLSKDHGYSIKDLYADNVKIYKNKY